MQVGLPTRAGTARFIVQLAQLQPLLLVPHASRLLRTLHSSAVNEKSEVARSAYAAAAAQVRSAPPSTAPLLDRPTALLLRCFAACCCSVRGGGGAGGARCASRRAGSSGGGAQGAVPLGRGWGRRRAAPRRGQVIPSPNLPRTCLEPSRNLHRTFFLSSWNLPYLFLSHTSLLAPRRGQSDARAIASGDRQHEQSPHRLASTSFSGQARAALSGECPPHPYPRPHPHPCLSP